MEGQGIGPGRHWSAARMSLRLRLDDVAWTPLGEPMWLEGRSDRSAVMVVRATGTEDLVPDKSIRAGVGYGGGDFSVGAQHVYFVQRSGPLFRIPLSGGASSPVLPRFGSVSAPVESPDGSWVLCLHSLDDTDVLALAQADGGRWPVDLVRGADFYMQPVWHPDSRRLAWIEWDHPNMPWDGARLLTGRLDPLRPALSERTLVAGGPGQPVFQPTWSPDGSRFAWIESDGEAYLLKCRTEADGATAVLHRSEGLLPPAWVQGMRAYCWADSATLWVLDQVAGIGRVLEVGLDGSCREIPIPGFSQFGQICASPVRREFLVIASAPDRPDRVLRCRDDSVTEIVLSMPDDLPPGSYPDGEAVRWTVSGETVHGLLFTPRDRPRPSGGWPLLVNVHGGPTASRAMGFSSDTCYWCDRGMAVLEVNYRGSTGYGESYRKALDGAWGEIDVDDCVAGARSLVERGVADGNRLAIKGGSAGGFTVLNAVWKHPGFFRAGVSNYGVSDLEQLELTTHKFEAKYLHGLVGPYPREKELFRRRSPVHHADSIRDPLAIFQGSDDKVVPPDQAERIVDALRTRAIPHHYRVFEGEGHGWRKSETILAYYTELESFLTEHLS